MEMNEEVMVDIRIRKVARLETDMHENAINIGFVNDDLVIVKTTIEKITGSPIQYLQDRIGAGKGRNRKLKDKR